MSSLADRLTGRDDSQNTWSPEERELKYLFVTVIRVMSGESFLDFAWPQPWTLHATFESKLALALSLQRVQQALDKGLGD